MYLKSVLSLSLVALCSYAQAQSTSSASIPPPPNSTAMGVYGEIPVSTYTGIPNIGIPLGTLQGYHLTVPVTLSYHAAGVRPQDIAPWTGSNWTLNAGGAITRVINGYSDFQQNTQFRHKGMATNRNLPSSIDEDCTIYYEDNPSQGYTNDVAIIDAMIGATSQEIDTQPDVFYFNFGGYAGRFVFDENGDIIKTSGSDLYFEHHPTTDDEDYWKIIDPSGIAYYFGNMNTGDQFNEYVSPDPNDWQNHTGGVSTWYLQKIEHPLGETATFTYDLHTFDYNAGNTVMISHLVYSQSGTNPCSNNLRETFEGAISANALYLSSITIEHDNGYKTILEVEEAQDRNDDPAAIRLDRIKLVRRNSANVLLETLRSFDFEYFNLSNRLYLRSISEANTNNTHSFLYNNPGLVPSTNNNAVDFWGYYNGSSNALDAHLDYGFRYNGSPGVYDKLNNYYSTSNVADRAPDQTYMQYGILSRIIYPTGGYTDFEYEANQFENFNWSKTSAPGSNYGSGLRIKSIKTYDNVHAGPATTKTYEYLDPSTGKNSGILMRIPFNVSIYGKRNYTTTEEADNNYCYYYATLSKPKGSLNSEATGTFVGYTHVTEYLGTTTDNIGKIEYTYKNVEDSYYAPSDASQNMTWNWISADLPTLPIGGVNFDNGRIEKQRVFKRNGSTYILQSEELYTYEDRITNTTGLVITGPTLISGETSITQANAKLTGKAACWGLTYLHYLKTLGYSLPDEVKSRTYDDAGNYQESIQETVYIQGSDRVDYQRVYPNFNYGGKTERHYYYADNAEMTQPAHAEMVNRNMIGIPIQVVASEKFSNFSDPFDEDILSVSYTDFALLGNDILPVGTFQHQKPTRNLFNSEAPGIDEYNFKWVTESFYDDYARVNHTLTRSGGWSSTSYNPYPGEVVAAINHIWDENYIRDATGFSITNSGSYQSYGYPATVAFNVSTQVNDEALCDGDYFALDAGGNITIASLPGTGRYELIFAIKGNGGVANPFTITDGTGTIFSVSDNLTGWTSYKVLLDGGKGYTLSGGYKLDCFELPPNDVPTCDTEGYHDLSNGSITISGLPKTMAFRISFRYKGTGYLNVAGEEIQASGTTSNWTYGEVVKEFFSGSSLSIYGDLQLTCLEVEPVPQRNYHYDSFENGGTLLSSNAKTGIRGKQLSGAYTFYINGGFPGDYVLTYWWRPDLTTPWSLQIEEKPDFIAPTSNPGAYNFSTSKTSGYIDELRFMPKTSYMETRTYNSKGQVTSVTSPDNHTVYYKYDAKDRLYQVVDEHGNTLEQREYTYFNE